MWFENFQPIRVIGDLIDSLNNLFSVTAYPSASADDGYNLQHSILYNSYDYIVFGDRDNFSLQGGWVRFTNVAIPNGAIIKTAIMRIKAYSSKSATTNVKIHAVLADNPSAPASASAIHYATKTTAYAPWDVVPFTAGTWYETPDLSAVIQEVVNQAGWASGNAMIIDLINNASGYDHYREFYSFDYSYGANKAELIVTY